MLTGLGCRGRDGDVEFERVVGGWREGRQGMRGEKGGDYGVSVLWWYALVGEGKRGE